MKEFGKVGTETAHLYEIKGKNGIRAELTEYGATLVQLLVNDKNGHEVDVVCGYDCVEDYVKNTCYFGATVGRNANRIANAKFTLNGKTIELEQNDNENNLHSGKNGLSDRMWSVKSQCENAITFAIRDEAYSDDFPGNLEVEVTYTLTDDNALEIHYHAITDEDTICNFTNHSYFNLNGHDAGLVYDHELIINANEYTPDIDSKAIPTGELCDVTGTPFDFRKPKTIGAEIESGDQQLVYVNGYDHNYVINQSKDYVARVTGDKSGIVMEMKTDLPGVQLYTANFIGGQIGKGGAQYVKRGALCLESQYFPNNINQENFESAILRKGEVYDTTTSYRFFV